MKLLSVNVSHPREVAHGRKTVRTGIFKEPVASRVVLRELKLDGDGQADLVNHGGLHRAVYVYPYTESGLNSPRFKDL
jgi:MOSC domain-containing protein YiiM